MRSDVVVLPASICAMIPMFRVRSMGMSRDMKTSPWTRARPLSPLGGACGLLGEGLALAGEETGGTLQSLHHPEKPGPNPEVLCRNPATKQPRSNGRGA